MAVHEPGPDPARRPGIVASLRALAATAVGLLSTRLELLAAELEEERLRIVQLVLFGALALAFMLLGVLLLTLFVVVMFWDTHRLAVTGALAAGYLGLAVAFGMAARTRLRTKSGLFSGSLAELAKDRNELEGRDVH